MAAGSSGSLNVMFRMPVSMLYDEETISGGVPSIMVTGRSGAADMPLPVRSATAPSETDRVMVSPTVVRWAALSVAVMVSFEWVLVETTSSATVPFSPVSSIPE